MIVEMTVLCFLRSTQRTQLWIYGWIAMLKVHRCFTEMNLHLETNSPLEIDPEWSVITRIPRCYSHYSILWLRRCWCWCWCCGRERTFTLTGSSPGLWPSTLGCYTLSKSSQLCALPRLHATEFRVNVSSVENARLTQYFNSFKSLLPLRGYTTNSNFFYFLIFIS
jgi:hypothetical protein